LDQACKSDRRGMLRLFRNIATWQGFLSVVRPGSAAASSMASAYYRADGVRITHDPYAPGMVEKYGRPGETDNEGFDPYGDSVGPGIYGGIVKRDPNSGEIVIGRQYQNHNTRPGPVYAGGGYTPMSNALRKGESALKPLLDKYPDLANEITTGGASPLHMCGMGRDNQGATAYMISRGGDIEALDTYGMTPLHRMASNNLAVGAEALLKANADPNFAGKCGATPLQIAMESQGREVIQVIRKYGGTTTPSAGPKPKVAKTEPQNETCNGKAGKALTVKSSGVQAVNHKYDQRNPTVIPEGFAITCRAMGWNTKDMWLQLSDQKTPWFEAENGSYIYWNKGDGKWWIDAPDGGGVYVAKAPNTLPPANGWVSLSPKNGALPVVDVA